MRLATVDQAKDIDRLSQSEYGLSAEVLMESAGSLAAREIDLTFLPELNRGGVAVVCGPGNNGGDGLVVARHLHASGHRELAVFLAAPESSRSELFRLQLRRLEVLGLPIVDLLKNPAATAELKHRAVIVDALFGIGFRDRIGDPFTAIVQIVNDSQAQRVSLDAPSGLNCDTGRADGIAVRADLTISFGIAKPGFFIGAGPQQVGKLRVLPMGFPREVIERTATTHVLFTEKSARRALPVREDHSNKSDHGRLLVVAGSPGYWGAGILSSSAAFRMGAGYVMWASVKAPDDALKEIPEVITSAFNDPELLSKKISAVAIGPGLEPNAETARWIEKLKGLKNIPVVVDAGGIQACVNHGLWPLPEHWVITPHSGELARVLECNSEDIEHDRVQSVFSATQKTGCHVLLKGYRSLLAHKDRCWIVHAGNAALAKAGTGDVLTGMIGALLAQGLETPKAAATAAFLHGWIADEWLRSGFDKASLTASDLKAILPQVVSRLRSGGGLFS